MATNDFPLADEKKSTAEEKLLPSSDENDQVNDSPVIKICTPSEHSRSKYCSDHESMRLKRLDAISDDLTIHEAARRCNLKILRELKERGENLEERDYDEFCPIHHAVRANQCEVIEFLLDSNVNVNTSGGKNRLTPLHVSVRYSNLEATKILLFRRADPRITAQDGSTPLHFAVRHGAYDFAEILLGDHRSDVNASDNSGMTPFHLACVTSNLQLCKLFLKHGADILATTARGQNSLHIAAASGHSPIVELVIITTGKDQSVDLQTFIDARDFEGNTPLHLACERGNIATVEVCLRHGADVEARNDISSNSPLHVASMAGQTGIVELLIKKGASVTTLNALHQQPIHLASLFGHCDVIRCLIKKGSPIDQREYSSLTPFLCAVKTGRAEVIKLLIECGANTGMRTGNLQTCFHLAVHNKHMDVLHLLVDLIGAEDLAIGDENLQLPLHFCACSKNLKILEFLLSKNIDPSPKDILGKTPLHIAAANGSMDCVRALVGAAHLHINDTDGTFTTPLHEAAVGGHSKVCQYLLRCGANVTAIDSSHSTALHYAARSGDVSTVDAILNCSTSSCNQIIDVEDIEGNTPLIVAAKTGEVEVVRLLIKRKADVSLRNTQNQTCLDVAVENGRQPVAMEIVKSERWYDVLCYRPQDYRYPMKDLIESMPSVAEVVMNRCMKYSDLDPKHRDYWIQFDFRLLHPEKHKGNAEVKAPSKSDLSALKAMIEREQEHLISHPLTEMFLLFRWNCLGRPIFWMNLIFYLIFVSSFTAFLVGIRRERIFYDPNNNVTVFIKMEHNYVISTTFLTTIVICIHMLKEIYQILSQKLKYFYHFTNYLEWGGFSTTLVTMLLYLTGMDTESNVIWLMGALALLFIYFNLILFLRRLGMFGIYISMFLEVLKSMTKVMVVFSLFIFAFGLAFHILLKEEAPFVTLFWSFVRTSMMMIGDFDFVALMLDDKQIWKGDPAVPVFIAVIFMIFCFFMPVLLMNLLIGLAVGDIDAIKKNATMKRKAMEVNYLASIEEKIPPKILDYFYKPITVIYPNRQDAINIIKFSTFGSSGQSFYFDKIQPRDRPKDKIKILAIEPEEQKTLLMIIIVNQLQTSSDRFPTTRFDSSFDGIDAHNLKDVCGQLKL